MKYIYVLLLFLLVPLQAFSWCSNASTWSRGDTMRQALEGLLRYVDYKQTREFLSDQYVWIDGYKYRTTGYHENNILLGKYPSKSRLVNSGIAYMLAHTTVAACLSKQARVNFQIITLTISTGVVLGNYQTGIRVQW